MKINYRRVRDFQCYVKDWYVLARTLLAPQHCCKTCLKRIILNDRGAKIMSDIL